MSEVVERGEGKMRDEIGRKGRKREGKSARNVRREGRRLSSRAGAREGRKRRRTTYVEESVVSSLLILVLALDALKLSLQSLESRVLVVRSSDVGRDLLELFELRVEVALRLKVPNERDLKSAPILNEQPSEAWTRDVRDRKRERATRLVTLLGSLDVADLSLVELLRIHLGSSISDDVDTSGEVTLTEESEESGEGLEEQEEEERDDGRRKDGREEKRDVSFVVRNEGSRSR